jgi:ribosome modulation factor
VKYIQKRLYIKGHCPINKLTSISDNHEQIVSAYQLLERNGYLSVEDLDIVACPVKKTEEKNSMGIHPGGDNLVILGAGKKAASSGDCRSSNPYKKGWERDVWNNGWHQKINELQSEKNILENA